MFYAGILTDLKKDLSKIHMALIFRHVCLVQMWLLNGLADLTICNASGPF